MGLNFEQSVLGAFRNHLFKHYSNKHIILLHIRFLQETCHKISKKFFPSNSMFLLVIQGGLSKTWNTQGCQVETNTIFYSVPNRIYVRICCNLYKCIWLYFLSIEDLTNYSCTKH